MIKKRTLLVKGLALVLTLVLVYQPFLGVSAEPAETWSKVSPMNTATGVSINPTLDWEDVTHTGLYYICSDYIINDYCDFGWFTSTESQKSYIGLAGSTMYEWQVYTFDGDVQLYADSGAWWTFTTEATLGDEYEEDDTHLAANLITSGSTQDRSIVPQYDEDWVSFHLSGPSGITLQTAGPGGDTVLHLFDHSMQLLETNDDYHYMDNYSLIDRFCGLGSDNKALPGGDYYAMVEQYNDDGMLSEYTLSFTVTPCNVNFLPLVVKPYIAPPGAFGKVSPSNESGSVSINPLLDWQDSSGATSYQYCYDTGTSGACTGTWYDAGSTSQATPAATLANGETYRWQVRASNAGGTTLADSDTMWIFTTENWTNLMSEGFEGTWLPPAASPSLDTSTTAATWQVYDMNGPTGGLYMPASRNCNPHSGSNSLWMVGGGFDGSGLGCGANYPNYVESWAVYGPFSTVGVTNLRLNYAYWVNAYNSFDPDTYDSFCVSIGTDINNPTTWDCYSSTTFPIWDTRQMDLDTSSYDVVGQPSVYLALYFQSDATMVAAAGAYADDISIVTCNAGDISCGSTASPNLSAVQDFLSPFTDIFNSSLSAKIK